MCNCGEKKQIDEYIVSWRCWVEFNEDIVEYNSIEHCWNKIPDDGFQAMRLWYSDGTGRYISGNDFYFLSEHKAGLIIGQSNDTDIKERYPNAIIKRGKHVPDKLMKEITDLMLNSKNPLNAY